jgi:hypothetical protein
MAVVCLLVVACEKDDSFFTCNQLLQLNSAYRLRTTTVLTFNLHNFTCYYKVLHQLQSWWRRDLRESAILQSIQSMIHTAPYPPEGAPGGGGGGAEPLGGGGGGASLDGGGGIPPEAARSGVAETLPAAPGCC